MTENKNHITPPKLAVRLLLWFLKGDLAEEVLGDLDEKFALTIEGHSVSRAKRNYWYQVLKYIRPFAIKQNRIFNSNSNIMLKHNFQISFRHLLKNKGYSLINIGGLTLGMSVVILISLWIEDEWSFNTHHDNYAHIAKVLKHQDDKGERLTDFNTQTGLGTLLKTDYADHFEHVVMSSQLETLLLSKGQKKFTESGYYMQDGAPEMFSLKMKYGNWTGLKEPNSVLISASLAEKLFGHQEPVGELININAVVPRKVTGVFEDLPKNSELHEASFIGTFADYTRGWLPLNDWRRYATNIYVQISPNKSMEEVSSTIKDVMQPHLNDYFKGLNMEAFLLPMSDWHLKSEFKNGVQVTSMRLQFVRFYGLIASFVLILACINFMNLSTARSERRIREIGVRKAIGANRRLLIQQFYTESFLYSTFAFIPAVILTSYLLPEFNILFDKNISPFLSNPTFWSIGLAFILFTTLIAGSYPALHMSSFKPIRALRGTLTKDGTTVVPRKVLVTFQFVISISLIIGTISVNDQIQFAKNRPVGYSIDGLLSMNFKSPEYRGKYNALRNELKSSGVVTEIAESDSPVTAAESWGSNFDWDDRTEGFAPVFHVQNVTHDFGQTIGWEFVRGRDFSREFATDQRAVIINESAAQTLKMTDPIGQTIRYDPFYSGNMVDYKIIGVTKDVIKGSPFKSTDPAISFLSSYDKRWLFIRVDPNVSMTEALPKIETSFYNILPSALFDYRFVSQEYESKFLAEQRIGKLANIFGLLAISISCLGLVGLSSYVAEQRSKEIGIRKVLGASITNLWGLVSKDFLALVIIACVISIPLAYFILDYWLQSYEHHILVSWLFFLYACVAVLIITLFTVSFQALKVAFANPVKSLRSE